jgi:hypothetical protein
MALKKRTKSLLDLAPNILAATGIIQTAIRGHKLEEQKISLLVDIKRLHTTFGLLSLLFLGVIIAILYQILVVVS